MAQISQVMVKQLPERRMLSVRKTIHFFEVYSFFMGSCVESIQNLFKKNGAYPAGGPIVCFHNVELETLDVEIGFEVAQAIQPEGAVQAVTVPPQTVATTIDRGPYEAQDPTLEALMQWIPAHGFSVAGGIHYHYLNDESQPQGEYLTQMYIPVQRAPQ